MIFRLGRGSDDRISIRHVVGVGPDGDYLPMLWDTFRHSRPRAHLIDFKYQKGRSPWGLAKRVVFDKAQFIQLLCTYSAATGQVLIAGK